MTRSHRLSPADLHLWRQVTETVTPLPGRERLSDAVPLPVPPKPALEAAPVAAPPPAKSTPKPPARVLNPGTVTDLDRRSAERLRRGDMTIDARLDLHGLRQDEAHPALDRFLAASQAIGRRCVLVITGKGFRDGTGVLKDQVPLWLNQAPNRARVLAIMPARPQHGGAGALYVLLKRIR
jgi:DNA-nicking Smr family endonuclease